MQAIILAAGMGKRLGDLTKDNTKCMIKVNGTYLIDRLLSQLACLQRWSRKPNRDIPAAQWAARTSWQYFTDRKSVV